MSQFGDPGGRLPSGSSHNAGWYGGDAHVTAPKVEVADDGKANPFVCNICNKTYGRIDHLARHFRSHTNEKPFKCQECGKGFARVDLLRRHANLHTGDERSNKKRRVRASRACEACATVKVKCDQEKPCKRCQLNGLECRVEPSSNSVASLGDSGFDQSAGTPDHEYSQAMPSQQTSGEGQQSIQQQNNFMAPPPPSSRTDHANAALITDEQSLTEFLRDIMQTAPAPFDANAAQRGPNWSNNGTFTPRNLMDFGQDLSMDFADFDGALTNGWDSWMDPSTPSMPMDQPTGRYSDVSTPSIDDSIGMGTAAFRRSAWQWVPNHEKGNQHEMNLASYPEIRPSKDQVLPTHQQCITDPLDLRARDKIVAMLLAVCDKTNYQRIVGFFPAAPVLDTFISNFLVSLEHSNDDWIHVPGFSPNESIPELLSLIIAGGAIASHSERASKFGYALQETCRLAIPDMFERDASTQRSLQALQAYVICLDIGIWSGNKRTMQLAESQALPLITMLRRSGRFRRPLQVPQPPSLQDSPSVLEKKWRDWIEAESFKRLAYHVFLYSAQVSIAFRTPPLISFAEITLDLPAPRQLWRATNAVEWRDRYIALGMGTQLPSFVQNIYNPQSIGLVRFKISLDLTLYLVLLGHWCLVWEYTQLNAAEKAQTSPESHWTGSLFASSQRQELRRLMDNFQVEIDGWRLPVPKEVQVVAELLRMNLYVGFEDLQLLAGKEGEEEARQVLPSLKKWFNSPDSREALWHAGQVVRAARQTDPNELNTQVRELWLRDFHAIALYHAGLAFWVYGLLTRTLSTDEQADYQADPAIHPSQLPLVGHSGSTASMSSAGDVFHVDGDFATPLEERHRFISLGRGIPVIAADTGQGHSLPLSQSKQVMDAIIKTMTKPSDLLRIGRNKTPVPRPAMVDNLTQLLHDLGEAASAV